MDRQETRQQTAETPNKLVSYWWVDAALAVRQFRNGNSIFVSLKKGHSLISDQAFVDGLAKEHMHVIMLPNYCAALVEWHVSVYGRTLNILTVTASDIEAHADEALEALLSAAKHGGADMVFSIGRPGWQEIVERHGFTTKPCLFMQKVIQ